MLLSEYIQTVRVILESLEPPEIVVLEPDPAVLKHKITEAMQTILQEEDRTFFYYKAFNEFDPFLFADGSIGWSGTCLPFAVWSKITIGHLLSVAMQHFFQSEPKEVEVYEWKKLGELVLESVFSAQWPERLLSKVDDCTICTEPLYVCIQTPCEHEFHAPCLERWLRTQTTCPLCRTLL